MVVGLFVAPPACLAGEGDGPRDGPRPAGDGEGPRERPRPTGDGEGPRERPRPTGDGEGPRDRTRTDPGDFDRSRLGAGGLRKFGLVFAWLEQQEVPEQQSSSESASSLRCFVLSAILRIRCDSSPTSFASLKLLLNLGELVLLPTTGLEGAEVAISFFCYLIAAFTNKSFNLL